MKSNITGRDTYIIAKAPYCAIKYQTLFGRSGVSDTQDVKAILLAKFPDHARMLVHLDEFAGLAPVDLVDQKADTFSDEPWN